MRYDIIIQNSIIMMAVAAIVIFAPGNWKLMALACLACTAWSDEKSKE
jgi:hypothetical protein